MLLKHIAEIIALIRSFFSVPLDNLSRARYLRLLCWIRFFALTGQSVAIAVAQFRLSLALDYSLLWIVILSMWGLLIFSWWQSGQSVRVSEWSYGLNIAFELIGFSILMYLSGGATNPFVFYYLVPLSIGVATLGKRQAWLTSGFCIAVYTLLMFHYHYLALFDMSHTATERLLHSTGHSADYSSVNENWRNPHILGMWMNFVVSTLLITYFVSRMADQIRSQEREIANLDQQQREDEHLLAMGTFAAGTAHELGTPLSSLAIILQDLVDQPGLDEDQSTELKVACGEVERCREILQSLVTAAHSAQTSGDRLISLGELLDSLKNQSKNLFPSAQIAYQTQNAEGLSTVQLISDTALEQSLLNLYVNALEAGQSQSIPRIEVRAEVLGTSVQIIIRDFGPGLSSEMQAKLGHMLVSNKPNGLGIGYFLANASINRIGGKLSIMNLPEGGAQTVVELLTEAPSFQSDPS